ncbi:GPR1/FUN34/YaaH family transporter [Amycolatopsis rhabdoformis]|uniref:GPR1/FUN34/YaaH family transporter n=1 Tax=Amycolatopsis rhabdoformis TaxID=1448059 RepID=A0ABZ1IA15_9PSEU|nr:GPR1/FUN34/YaaH family transporter [Amycolatopsis rhabdoformis]WSE31265.1 GPR1/FUN34/YaaH family transporter [Amycolatopsis rhabdoformis]
MTVISDDTPDLATGSAGKTTEPEAPVPTANPLAGNPGVIGVPTVIAGALGLGLVNVGALPGGAAGATLAILGTCTAVGLLITTIWAAALGQSVSAGLFAVFFGFYASYVVLTLGLAHSWFGGSAVSATDAQVAWLWCWLITIVLVTLVTLRLPASFTLMLGFVDVALALLLAGTMTGATGLIRAGGAVVFAFVAVQVYLYADLMFTETGGRGLPLGRPLVTR